MQDGHASDSHADAKEGITAPVPYGTSSRTPYMQDTILGVPEMLETQKWLDGLQPVWTLDCCLCNVVVHGTGLEGFNLAGRQQEAEQLVADIACSCFADRFIWSWCERRENEKSVISEQAFAIAKRMLDLPELATKMCSFFNATYQV